MYITLVCKGSRDYGRIHGADRFAGLAASQNARTCAAEALKSGEGSDLSPDPDDLQLRRRAVFVVLRVERVPQESTRSHNF